MTSIRRFSIVERREDVVERTLLTFIRYKVVLDDEGEVEFEGHGSSRTGQYRNKYVRFLLVSPTLGEYAYCAYKARPTPDGGFDVRGYSVSRGESPRIFHTTFPPRAQVEEEETLETFMQRTLIGREF